MKTLLVPIDFSENALHALQYAVNWSTQFNGDRIVLYHSNRTGNATDERFLEEMERVKERFPIAKTTLIGVVNNDKLVDGIAVLIREYQVSMIVMGITGRNKAGQKLIGSCVFKVSENVDIPVLVVPSGAEFRKLENIALALPIMTGLKNHIPSEEIRKFLKKHEANLMIVNVAKGKDKTPKSTLYAGLADIFGLFDELDPTFHFLTANYTADRVADFAQDNHAHMLICISGKHGLLREFFKPSVTKKLAYHSTVPLLIYRMSGK